MSRKPHPIQHFGRMQPPGAVICVQACRRTEYAGDADEYGTKTIAAWHSAVASVSGRISVEGVGGSGTTEKQFWKYLATTFPGAKDTLIISVGAREHAVALGLWDRVLDGNWQIYGFDPLDKDGGQGYVVLESPPTIIKFTHCQSKRTFTWIDPSNLGCTGYTPTADNDDATIDTCRTIAEDVRGWWLGYARMLSELRLGEPSHTSASQAANGYRLSYMDYAIYVHDNDAVLRMERAALFGGRNECRVIGVLNSEKEDRIEDDAPCYPNWQAGLFDGPQDDQGEEQVAKELPVRDEIGPIYQVDFNSLYPAVACDNLLPVKLRGVLRSPSVSTLLEACRVMPVVATLRVRTEIPAVPCWIDPLSQFPHSITSEVVRSGLHGLRHRMVFPVGDFLTCLCGPEILLAAQHGSIVSCGAAALYEGRPIYHRWVRTLYAERRRLADAGRNLLANSVKSLLNSSFAKWSQLKRRWVSEPGELCPWPWDQFWRENEDTGDLEQWRCFAWAVQRLEICGEPGDSFPAITAYVNSLARVQLWRAMEACDPGRVFYVDTDSIWTDQTGFDQLQNGGWLHATELGKLKAVGAYHRVELFGLKRYLANDKLTVAGAHGETVRTSDAWALAFRPMPTHSFLQKHRPPGIDLRTVRFRLNLPYQHGHVQPDGTVLPIALADGGSNSESAQKWLQTMLDAKQ